MTSRVRHVTVDALDPYAQGVWWAQVVGGRVQDDDHPGDPSVLVTSAGPPLLFEQVQDGGTALRNRVHLDLQPDTTREQEVARLVALGATVVADRTRPDGSGWVVLADPEGNELCVERSPAERGPAAEADAPERRLGIPYTSGERALLDRMLDWYREGVLAKVAGLSDRDAAAVRLPSGTTVAGLVRHLALVEDHWFEHGLAGRDYPEVWAALDFDADPDAEFTAAATAPFAESVALYEQACARSRAVAATLELDDLAVRPRHGADYTLRFVLLHMVEETARHLGHLDVLRELTDGQVGE